MEQTEIWWIVCECYVWPVYPATKFSACGKCGSREYKKLDGPAPDKAMPLKEYASRYGF